MVSAAEGDLRRSRLQVEAGAATCWKLKDFEVRSFGKPDTRQPRTSTSCDNSQIKAMRAVGLSHVGADGLHLKLKICRAVKC